MEAKKLYDTVISNGYCIGCGACALMDDSPFKINMDKFGQLVAHAKAEQLDKNKTKVLDVCPFSDNSKNEDELSELFFPTLENRNSEIGKYISCYAGFVKEGNFRTKGSSGGFAKWIGYQLLKEKKIDFFVQLSSNSTNDSSKLLFDYQIFQKPKEILQGSKSAYYPTTLVNILKEIKGYSGSFAITAIPCNSKALRLLALKDNELKNRLKYIIGVVCGGMKSANYSKLVGWELGIHPNNLAKIDFRQKYDNRPANEKIYQVWSNEEETKSKDVSQIYGTGYASGFFKPKACDYCDDVLAETADIAIGDAWLKKYVQDPKGTSILVVRNYDIENVLKKSHKNGQIILDSINADDAATSQRGGLRHRREGLSLRLAKKEKKGEWAPVKRVKANQFIITNKRKRIYEIREKIAQKSHVAFLEAIKANKLSVFHRKMDPLILRFAIVNFSELLPRMPRRFYLYVKSKIKNKI